MIYTEMTKKAMKYMFEHHKNQSDKSGIPYVFHPFTVAYNLENEEECVVALLHDIVEDTDVTFEDLENEGFSATVIDTLKLLTHRNGEDYFVYIDRISKNELASKVKIQDLLHNMQDGRLDSVTEKDIQRKEKYKKALDILKGAIMNNNKGWVNYDADDAFHIEKHIDGIEYGSSVILKKLQKQRESLYNNNKLEDAMYGFAIADALGVPAEFKSRNTLSKNPVVDMVGNGTHNVPEGTWSDDTSMVLATQDSINSCGKIDYDDIMSKFVAWYKNGEYTADGNVFDIGNTTANSIRNYSNKVEAVKCGGTGERDNGNGSLMRMIPIAFYVHDNKITDERVEIISNASSLTHAHDISKLGCLIYCDYVCELLNGNSKMAALINVRGNDYSKYFSKDIVSKYDKILKGNLSNLSENEISSSGYVVNTLTAAIWCLLTTNKYEEAVLKAVNLGEDTDTVAAICGSLAGLVYTKKNIPSSWIEKLKNKELLDNIIKGYKKKSNLVSNFELIKNQLLEKKNDTSFDKSLLETLTQEEKSQIEEILINEILNHNVNCYYYIDCLTNVDRINDEFLSTLTGTFRYVVLKGLYLVNHDENTLNELVENAYQNMFCFDLLADIYLKTKDEQIYEIISKIYSEMNQDPAYEFIVSSKLNMIKGHSV